jgi:hypothetical protein
MTAQIMFRMYTSSHTILKTLAALDGVSMAEALDKVMRQAAIDRGLVLNEPKDPVYTLSVAGSQRGD